MLGRRGWGGGGVGDVQHKAQVCWMLAGDRVGWGMWVCMIHLASVVQNDMQSYLHICVYIQACTSSCAHTTPFCPHPVQPPTTQPHLNHPITPHHTPQGGWLSPRVTNATVQYLTHAVQLSRTYKLLKPHLHGLLVNAIFPLCCFDDADETMWEEDPHEYIRKGYDILEDMYSPKTAAMNFIHEMSRVRSQGNLEPLMAHLVAVLNQHAAAGVATAPKHLARKYV